MTSPTNPITPETAIALPVSSDVIRKRIHIVNFVLTPRDHAADSPSLNAFRGDTKRYDKRRPKIDIVSIP